MRRGPRRLRRGELIDHGVAHERDRRRLGGPELADERATSRRGRRPRTPRSRPRAGARSRPASAIAITRRRRPSYDASPAARGTRRAGAEHQAVVDRVAEAVLDVAVEGPAQRLDRIVRARRDARRRARSRRSNRRRRARPAPPCRRSGGRSSARSRPARAQTSRIERPLSPTVASRCSAASRIARRVASDSTVAGARARSTLRGHRRCAISTLHWCRQ